MNTSSFRKSKMTNRVQSLLIEQNSIDIKQNKTASNFELNKQNSMNFNSANLIRQVDKTQSQIKILKKRLSKSFEKELKNQSSDKMIESILNQRETKKKKIKKVYEGDTIFLEIHNEIFCENMKEKKGFSGILSADGVATDSLFSLEKSRSEELQPKKYLFEILINSELDSELITDNLPIIFGQNIYLKHLFSKKYLKIEMEDLVNENGRVSASLTEKPSKLVFLPSTLTKREGQNVFYGDGLLISPSNSKRIFLRMEKHANEQNFYPVNGSEIYCEWIPKLYISKFYKNSLTKNVIVNGNLVKENNFQFRFSKKFFKFDSQIDRMKQEEIWIPIPFIFFDKNYTPNFEMVLESQELNPSVNSFWEIKSEHIEADNCEIKSKSAIRLKNVVSEQFLSFGTDTNNYKRPRLEKNFSKETTDIISEEIEKSNKINLKQEIDRLGKLMIDIKNKKESNYLEKEDLITLSLFKKSKYKLGIFKKKNKEKQNFRKNSQSINYSSFNQSSLKNDSFKKVFFNSAIYNFKNEFEVKFSEKYSSKQSFFKIKECNLLNKTEQLVSSSLEAVLTFYDFIQHYGFCSDEYSFYFDLDSIKKKESEFKLKSSNFLITLQSLEKFLKENMSKQKQQIFIDNYVIESLLYLLQVLNNKTIDCVAEVLFKENKDCNLSIVLNLLKKEVKTEGLFDPNLMEQNRKPEKVLNSLSEDEKEKFNRQRFNIPRFLFNRFKNLYEAILRFLYLVIYENTFYCIYLSKKVMMFLKLFYFFPDFISPILKEISLKIGNISFFDSRIERNFFTNSFLFEKLIKEEAFLYREDLLAFNSKFFDLSNSFIKNRNNSQFELKLEQNQFEFVQE